MNNLGGYKRVELLFVDELSAFIRLKHRVKIERTDALHRYLPLCDNSATLITTPKSNDAGTLYTHQCTLSLRARSLDSILKELLPQVNIRGCILIGTTSNEDIRVFGSNEYPLFGSFAEEYGSRRIELHQYKLTLTCSCLHPELELL